MEKPLTLLGSDFSIFQQDLSKADSHPCQIVVTEPRVQPSLFFSQIAQRENKVATLSAD